MALKMRLLADLKRQKGSITGIFLLVFFAAVSLTVAVTVFHNSGAYIEQEMERVGYGTFTAWVSGYTDITDIQGEIQEQDTVSRVDVQPLIFSGYSVNGIHSDNEGQLIPYEPEQYDYHFFADGLDAYAEVHGIESGEIYLSPSMVEGFGASIGDEIQFMLGRNGAKQIFKVAGFFEDPFMGSSMIDMKSFLISREDYEETLRVLNTVSEFNRIGREGAMLHIHAKDPEEVGMTELNRALNSATRLGVYSEMTYSAETIHGFMLVLQNIETGFLIGFSVLLLVVILIVIQNSIRNAMVQEYKDIGILKTIGCTSSSIWANKILEYCLPVFLGIITGVLAALPILQAVKGLTVTSTGVLIPLGLPAGILCVIFLALIGLLMFFVARQTRAVTDIRPIQAILGRINEMPGNRKRNHIYPECVGLSLACRQLLTGWKRYMGVFLIMTILTVFLSVVDKMSDWVGRNGEGLMNAFSVAEHDLGVQPMSSDVDMQEVAELIGSYSAITDTYRLAMRSGTVNGTDLTVNVLDEPEWFHVISGNTAADENDVLVTEMVAQDLSLDIGDEVTISSGGGTAVYTVRGIYECANEMGANVGMSIAGYARIADTGASIWCTHYILEDSSRNDVIMEELMARYRVSADIHTNSWSGLDGIVHTLHILILFMYAIALSIIGIVIVLSGSKVLGFEQKNLAIYKSIGYTSGALRVSFGIRYGMVAMAGAVLGTVISAFAADSLLSALLGNFGIGDVHVAVRIGRMLWTAGIIILFVFLFAVLASGKIRHISVKELLQRE